MAAQHIFTPTMGNGMTGLNVTRERSDIRIDAVFDIETANWTEFVVGGVYYADGSYECIDFRQEELFFERLCAIRGPGDKVGCLWSHNGGRFDIKWALDWAIRRGVACDAISAGSNIICATIGKTRFLDSKALTKISLEDLTKGASVSKEKLGLDCIGRENGCDEEEGECKGYCAISKNMPHAKFRRLCAYLEADCRSLYTALQRIREYAEENDLDLGISVGSSAWKNARRLLELPKASLSSSDHNFARQAYFGGRVQIFRPKASTGFEYDVNSMYPSRLAYEKVPIGSAKRVFGDVASRAIDFAPGIFRAQVKVAPMHIPPLPLRIGNRICYPIGSFIGTWTRDELIYASTVGVKIEKIDEALIWRGESIVFTQWVDKLFALRSQALGWDGKPDKKGPIGTWLKYYLNSLTGKFGSRPDNERVRIAPSLEEIELHTCKCDTYKQLQGKCDCGAWQQLDDAGNIYAEPRYLLQPCGHVEWAAYLTSQARVEWHKEATSVNEGWDMCYGDTDSNFCISPRNRNIGHLLGQWDIGEKWKNFEAFAPKVYRLQSIDTDSLKVKAKGLRLPHNPAKAEEVLRSGIATGKEAVVGFRAGARKGKFFATDEVKRRINIGYGDRILDGETTRAPTFREALTKWG